MDEPLSNLDAQLRNQMRAEILKLRQRIASTFIYVTHDQTEAMTLGDRIVIMKDGHVQQIGTPQEVFMHPANLFVAGFIGTPRMNFLPGTLDEDGSVTVCGTKLQLADGRQQRLREKAGSAVTLGIRPEHLGLCEADTPGAMKVLADVTELMGSTVQLHVTLDGKDIILSMPLSGDGDWEKYRAHVGAELYIRLQEENLHIFDAATGENLEL